MLSSNPVFRGIAAVIVVGVVCEFAFGQVSTANAYTEYSRLVSTRDKQVGMNTNLKMRAIEYSDVNSVISAVDTVIRLRAEELGITCSDNEALIALVPLLERQGLIDIRRDHGTLLSKSNENVTSWLSKQKWSWTQLVESGRNMVLHAKVTGVNVPLESKYLSDFLTANSTNLKFPMRVQLQPLERLPITANVPYFHLLLDTGNDIELDDALAQNKSAGDQSVVPYLELNKLRNQVAHQLVGRKTGDTVYIPIGKRAYAFTIRSVVPPSDLSTDEQVRPWLELSARVMAVSPADEANQILPASSAQVRGFIDDVWKKLKPVIDGKIPPVFNNYLTKYVKYINANPFVRFVIDKIFPKSVVILPFADVDAIGNSISELEKVIDNKKLVVRPGTNSTESEKAAAQRIISESTTRLAELRKFAEENKIWAEVQRLRSAIRDAEALVDKTKKELQDKANASRKKDLEAALAKNRIALKELMATKMPEISRKMKDLQPLLSIFVERKRITFSDVITIPSIGDVLTDALARLTGMRHRGVDGVEDVDIRFPLLPVTKDISN
jgi:hypothetical protein